MPTRNAHAQCPRASPCVPPRRARLRPNWRASTRATRCLDHGSWARAVEPTQAALAARGVAALQHNRFNLCAALCRAGAGLDVYWDEPRVPPALDHRGFASAVALRRRNARRFPLQRAGARSPPP